MPEVTRPNSRDGQHLALVYEQLRSAILGGELAPGDAMSQAALAREFNAGRTPLREALRLLQHEGLVVSEPKRRVRIAQLSGDDAEELYIMRISLEAVAIRITIPTLSSGDLAEIEGVMAQMDHYMRMDDRRGFSVPHRKFHLALVASAGPRALETVSQLFDHAERYRVRFGANDPEIWEQRRAEHRGIVEAVRAGDADLASERLVAHYAHTALLIFAALDPEHSLARLRTTIDIIAPGAESALQVT
jgi:DNA-binding GntR family transcriptional regulator